MLAEIFVETLSGKQQDPVIFDMHQETQLAHEKGFYCSMWEKYLECLICK